MRAGWPGRSGRLLGLQTVIILVVLGVASAVIRPRMSRGAAPSPAHADHVLVGHLRLLRSAVLSYAYEHCGQVPAGDADKIRRQLLQYTDISGRTSAVRRGPYMLGPYLREVPALPVGSRKGQAMLGVSIPGANNTHAGWIYDPVSGLIQANTLPGEHDPAGVPYTSY